MIQRVVLVVVSFGLLIIVSVGCNKSTDSFSTAWERLCPPEFEKYSAFDIECDSALVVEENKVCLVGYKANCI